MTMRLIADTRTSGKADIATARDFTGALAVSLGLPPALVLTAYEDVPRLLARRSRRYRSMLIRCRPIFRNPDERSRLARLLLSGLDKPAGFVLPLKAAHREPRRYRRVVWESSPWPLRRERLYAVAGDSPLGLRLPLGSLPDVLPAEVEHDYPVDPFAPKSELTTRDMLATQTGRARGATPREVVKTALTVQVRDGHLYVFMPPLTRLDDYVALLAAIEHTAAALRTPVVIEGYTPPRDPRVRVLNVTPDPGVIEVNVQPAVIVARVDGNHHDAVRRGAPYPTWHRKVHARRSPHGHRRRQSHHARRRHRLPTAHCCGVPICCRVW